MQTFFLDGVQVLFTYFSAVFLFFLAVLGAGLWVTSFSLREYPGFSKEFLVALSIGGIPLTLVSYLSMLLGYFVPALLKPISFILLLFLIGVVLKRLPKFGSLFKSRTFYYGAIFFFLLLLLRLAFLKYLLLPAYSDSPVHYQIIESFLHPENPAVSQLSFETFFQNYYHFGFHSLVSWLSLVSGIAPANAMSLIGQLFLTIAPFSLFCFFTTFIKDAKGAFFTAFLAAIGWHMPAFAVNWGKFPALIALALFPALVGFIFQGLSEKQKSKNIFILSLLIAGLALIHTRILIVLALMLAAHFTVKKINAESKLSPARSLVYTFFSIAILSPFLVLIQYFYTQPLILGVVILLFPFAFHAHSKSSLKVVVFVASLWLLALLPDLGIELVLLNRQFLEMILYIPLSLLGGIGLAALFKTLSLPPRRETFSLVGVALLVFLSFSRQGALYPDPCCNYFQAEDALAFDFLRDNTPEHTLVLISAFNNGETNLGTDAGAWIEPLLRQPTNRFPYDFNWAKANALQQICEIGAENTLIYVGSQLYSFNADSFNQANQYELLFDAQKTKIYQVKACSQ